MYAKISAALLATAVQAATSVAYDYVDAGASWPNLAVDGNVCGSTVRQSPINLDKSIGENSGTMEFRGYDYKDYVAADAKVLEIKGGHTMQMDFNDGKLMTTFPDGSSETFMPAQFHFHHPSEHV